MLPYTNNNYILFFFFNDTATTEIYTLSLHDALPIDRLHCHAHVVGLDHGDGVRIVGRSEEHTSELQSRGHLVWRLLLEKKKVRRDGRQHRNNRKCLSMLKRTKMRR